MAYVVCFGQPDRVVLWCGLGHTILLFPTEAVECGWVSLDQCIEYAMS
jgi:hypothetical protein